MINANLPPKIAVVVPKYGLVGGGEGFAAELSARIADNFGYDIHVFANKWIANSDKITFHKVPIVTFPKWLTTLSFAWFANKRIQNIGGFDLIHTHERIFKADICSMHFIPHRFWVEKIRKKKMLSLFDRVTIWVEEQMFNNDQCFFMPVSSIAQKKMMEQYPISLERQRVVHPGVLKGTGDSEDRVKSRLEVRGEFGIDAGDFVILFVAMNFELKGLDQLLTAVAQITKKSSTKNMKVLVVGKGNEKKYKALAVTLGVENQVVFTGVRRDMSKIYYAGDLFVLLSGFDTFAMVVSEAMIASLPVIVSNMVGAKDLVRNGENGFVVERHDLQLIISCIERMANNPEKRRVMGKMAKKSTVNCTWGAVAEMVAQQYDTILSGKGFCQSSLFTKLKI